MFTYEIVHENDLLPAHFSLTRTPPVTIPAHWHDYLEIVYFRSGKMTAVIQGESYELTPGDVLITNSEDIHMTQTFSPQNEYVLVQISAKHLKTFFPDFRQLRFSTWIPSAPYACTPAPSYYIEEMLHLFLDKEDGYQLLFSARLHELLFSLYRNYSHWNSSVLPVSSDRNFPRIARCIDWIHSHYSEALTLEDASSQLNLSREYFCRIFKKYTGQTFLEYLNAVRAEQLYKDLLRTDSSITELMDQHGITNYRVFLSAFRRLYGTTPQRIRSAEKQKLQPS